MKLWKRGPRGRARNTARSLVPLLPSVVRLLGGLMRDARVSLVDRGLLVAAIVYVVSPLDLLPDVLGVFGLTDDLFLLALVLHRLITRAGPAVLESHWTGAQADLRRLMDAMEELGSLLPAPVRGILESVGGER